MVNCFSHDGQDGVGEFGLLDSDIFADKLARCCAVELFPESCCRGSIGDSESWLKQMDKQEP